MRTKLLSIKLYNATGYTVDMSFLLIPQSTHRNQSKYFTIFLHPSTNTTVITNYFLV